MGYQPPHGQQPPYGPQPPYGQQPPPGYQWPYPYQPPPQQWQPPPRIDPKELRPSRLWYWLSPIPALVGVALAVVFVLQLVDRIDTDLDHLRAPGTVQLQLDAGDERAIYVQTLGAVGARPNVSAADLSCTVREAATERTLPLDESSGFTLTINNDEYVKRLSFDAPRAGRYSVTCTEPRGTPLAVGQDLGFGELAVPIVGIVLSFLIGVALTAAIAIMTAVKRSNHKQRLQREAMYRT